jgi:hypothetical protein
MATVRERGQLMLIGGLALAISLVAIALVLNSAIYTHNLASRYNSPGDDIVESNRDVRESASSQIRHANDEYADGGYGSIGTSNTVLGEYGFGISDIESEIAEDGALNGRVLRASHTSASQGVRIADAESGGSDFKSGTGASDWTVVVDGQARSYQIVALTSGTVSETTSNVLGGLLASSAFTIRLDEDGDGTDDWRVAIYEDGDTGASDISVTVENVAASTFQTCTVAETRVEIDFTQARVGSQSCSALLFFEDLSTPYDVRYEKGGNIGGSYRMIVDSVVDGPGSEVGPFTDRVDAANHAYHCGDDGDPKATFESASSGNYPQVSPAIYSTEIETIYESDEVTYQGTQRVAPGEAGVEPVTPRVTQFDVFDGSAGDNSFDITYAVSDPNDNLAEVDIEIADGDGEPPITGISGGSAGPNTVTRTDSGGGSSPYQISITVEDTDGNSRTVTQTHDDDGDSTDCPA